MAEKLIEFVVASDCACHGEAFLRGETRTVSKETYRELVAAGRVCMDDAAIDGAQADAKRRKGAERSARSSRTDPGDAKQAGETKPPAPPAS